MAPCLPGLATHLMHTPQSSLNADVLVDVTFTDLFIELMYFYRNY